MKNIILLPFIFITAVIIYSCSGSFTEISGTWTKPGYTGKNFKNILVVAISADKIKRNVIESAVVKEFGLGKIKATASEIILDFKNLDNDKDGKLDSAKRDEVLKLITDAGYDGAIVLSLLDIKEQTEYVPGQTYYQPAYIGRYGGYYRGFYGYSFHAYNAVNTPGYYVEKTNIYIETRLFDIKADDMLWASTSETMDPTNLKEFSQSLARAVVNTLITDKVVK